MKVCKFIIALLFLTSTKKYYHTNVTLTMTNYEAIKNLSCELLEKLLDQVFLAGFNIGHQFLVDPGIDDGNPFDKDWLEAQVEESLLLVVNDAGEDLIIKPLVDIIERIVEYDSDSIPDNVNWQAKIILPKGMDETDENEEC